MVILQDNSCDEETAWDDSRYDVVVEEGDTFHDAAAYITKSKGQTIVRLWPSSGASRHAILLVF
jgi:hypothetical protein